MPFTRRDFARVSLASSLSLLAERLLPQGMSRRVATPQARAALSGRPFDAHFVDVAYEAGLRAPVIYGGVDSKKYILEATGCGCAFIDYDNDGWLDIFLLSGTRLDGDPPGATNRLYKNNRDGTFTDVTHQAGLTSTGWASSVCVGDFNNDGFDDLFCTFFGQNRLYRNNGDGTFTDVTKSAGLWNEAPRWGAGCCFLDYDRDGFLDLFVANYVSYDPARAPKPGEAMYCLYNNIPVPCGPQGFTGGTNILYRNRGDGTFIDVSEESGIARPRGASTMVFVGKN